MAELLLDSNIRAWVFLPIIVISFLVGLLRHYVTIVLSGEKKLDAQQIKNNQHLLRSRYLRENGRFLPVEAFNMRKHYFNDKTNGFFPNQLKQELPVKNPMTDPSMMTEMMKGNVTNVLPMIVIGGWINWAFSGFLTTKVPFPLTLRFKAMLQRGVDLTSLDASWVSSASWYFLNVFGLRGVYSLLLGQDHAADQTKMMQEQLSGGGGAGMPPDPNKAFKAEWEALETCSHKWALEGIQQQFVGKDSPVVTLG